MNKHLKSLLLVSAIILPVSACSGNFHGKDGKMNHAHHKVMKNLERAKYSTENALRELDMAVATATDAKEKKHLQKLVKQADALASDIGKCKRMCKAKMGMNAEKTATTVKAKHKKSHHMAKPEAKSPADAAKTK